jgi:hypothetical protein
MPLGVLASLVGSCYDVWVDHTMAERNNNAPMIKPMPKVVAFVLLEQRSAIQRASENLREI